MGVYPPQQNNMHDVLRRVLSFSLRVKFSVLHDMSVGDSACEHFFSTCLVQHLPGSGPGGGRKFRVPPTLTMNGGASVRVLRCWRYCRVRLARSVCLELPASGTLQLELAGCDSYSLGEPLQQKGWTFALGVFCRRQPRASPRGLKIKSARLSVPLMLLCTCSCKSA